MNCQYCGKEFALKKNWIAKKCLCDDEERFVSLEDWYCSLFKVAFPTGFEPVTIRLEGECSNPTELREPKPYTPIMELGKRKSRKKSPYFIFSDLAWRTSGMQIILSLMNSFVFIAYI